MPNGNGMGPNGMGPRTGRGAGYCNGIVPTPGFGRGGRGFSGGFGGGFGRGRGPGRGYGLGYGRAVDDFDRGSYGTARRLSEEEYKGVLNDEVSYLENRLKALKEELDSSEKESK